MGFSSIGMLMTCLFCDARPGQVHAGGCPGAPEMSGEDMIAWRTRLELTQVQAGFLLDVSDRTIANYENTASPIPFSTYIACMAYEDWPWLRRRIDAIIARRSQR